MDNNKQTKMSNSGCTEQESLPRVSRRTLLTWSAPVITAVALPAHAQTSACTSMAEVIVTSSSKCSGSPPVGEALLEVVSDGADVLNDELEIRSINVVGAVSTDTVTLPPLPSTVTASAGAEISWIGNASDSVSCLPISSINFEIVFGCVGSSVDQTVTVDLTTLLADAI